MFQLQASYYHVPVATRILFFGDAKKNADLNKTFLHF